MQQQCIQDVSNLYRFDAIHQCKFPAAYLDTVPMSDIVTAIGNVIHEVRPDTVLLPYLYDAHSDHRYAFEAAYSCTKNFRHPSVKRVMMMETPSETDYAPAIPTGQFTPNVFVDISGYYDKKKEILSRYPAELGAHPFPRSLEGVASLATVRGAACGAIYVESFMLLKEIL
jgi:LmbE family N-acetylglucosaminyl deacetylase